MTPEQILLTKGRKEEGDRRERGQREESHTYIGNVISDKIY